jgi:predicted MFS family arabinose efflux permease
VLPFFNIYFADRFGLPVARIGTVFAAAQLATAVVLLATAELARRWGAQRTLVALMFVMPPALLALSVTPVLGVAVSLYVVQGAVAPATNPLIDQLLLERAPRERHGIVAGWRNVAAEGAGAVGASAGGKLLDVASYGTLLLAASAVAAASAMLLTVALRSGRARASADSAAGPTRVPDVVAE